MSEIRQSSNLDVVYDAVHGAVDLSAIGSTRLSNAVRRILKADFMQRLRKIKQLGFVSRHFISAEHNRFTHAVGSFTMMKAILAQLAGGPFWTRETIATDLLDSFPESFPKIRGTLAKNETTRMKLEEHLLLAALLQDVGELPYARVTAPFFSPDQAIASILHDKTNIDFQWRNRKHMFTIAIIWENERLFEDYDLRLLSFLISGYLPGNKPVGPGLKSLLHLVDGVFDADRLDYVQRDAFHAVGAREPVTAVLATLLDYDSQGPIFSSATHIAHFLIRRANLWNSVYLDPVSRFYLILLAELFKDLAVNGLKWKQAFARDFGDIGINDFITIHDEWIEDGLHRATDAGLSPKAQTALKLLKEATQNPGSDPAYEFKWLARKAVIPVKDLAEVKEVALPNDLFADTYTDYRDHVWYQRGSVRIRGSQFGLLASDQIVALEEASGPFNNVFRPDCAMMPMSHCSLVFLPKTKSGVTWERIMQILNAPGEESPESRMLHRQLELDDPFVPTTPNDSRKHPGFHDPVLFISFAFEDLPLARTIKYLLFLRKQKYLSLDGPFDGLGNPPRENIRENLNAAAAVLVVLTRNWISRVKSHSGYLSEEFREIGYARRGRPLDVKFVSRVPHSDADELDWNAAEFKEKPFLGPELAEVGLRGAVDRIVHDLRGLR